MGRLLIWLSGTSRRVLDDCPTERAKYGGIGAAILITAAMAGVSLAFALVTALKVELSLALPFAVAWGVAILCLDRLFVVSLPRKGKWYSHLFRAIPRVLLALLLGFVISTPFVLQIFRPEIEHEITILHDKAAAAYFRQLATSPLQNQINHDKTVVSNLTTAAGGGEPVNTGPQNARLQDLQTQLGLAESQQAADYSKWQCQLYGKAPDGTVCSPAGNGPLAQADEAAYKGDAGKVGQLNRQVTAEEKQISTDITDTQAKDKAEGQAQLPAAKKALQAAEAEQAQETSAFTSQNNSNGGLLIRLQALDAVTAGDSTLNAARWLLFTLFVVIDCMPVMIKVLLNLGPENNYDRLLAAEEKKQLRVAANSRALRQAAEMMAAETVIGEARSRLAGWNADIPEVTEKIIATRTRVETRKLGAWEDGQTRRLHNGAATVPSDTLPAEPPVGFIGWPWITGPTARRRWWQPAAWRRNLRLGNLRLLAYQVAGVRLRRFRSRGPRPPASPASSQQPYGAPFLPSAPGPLNGARRGAAHAPP